jgi:hypothetical protein
LKTKTTEAIQATDVATAKVNSGTKEFFLSLAKARSSTKVKVIKPIE